MKKSVLTVLMLMFTLFAEAQIPALSVKDKKTGGEVYLQSLNIAIDINGNVASTKYTMTFKNRTDEVLEGELLFPLQDGVTVSHYALDIDGKMRDAVPVEKSKGTQVFEEIEQRNVDPGLLERVEGNNFRTRIYPVPPKGTRTVSIGYEQELPVEKNAIYYRLPMDYTEPIEQFSIEAKVWKSEEKPQSESGLSGELIFDKKGSSYTASFSRRNYTANKPVEFSLPVQDIPQTIMQSASGSYYFTVSYVPKNTDVRKKEWESRLGIIWDVSLSGLRRDIKKELDLLDFVFKEKKELTVTLYLLNNRFTDAGIYRIDGGNWDELRKTLESAVYDGGTDYSVIDLKSKKFDELILFSDGLSTLGDASVSEFGGRIHCVVSSPRADYSAVKMIAARNNGKFINLNVLSQPELHRELTTETLYFLGIEKPSTVREVYPSIPVPVSGNFSVAGILDAHSADITLLFGYGNRAEERTVVKLQSKDAAKEGFVYRIWAQKKINELDMQYDKNRDELTRLGQQFGIVTRNTSLIVLETLQDYITYEITPPKEMLDDYMHWKKDEEDSRRQMENNLLANAVKTAGGLKKWWKSHIEPVKPQYPQPDHIIVEDFHFSENDSEREAVDMAFVVKAMRDRAEAERRERVTENERMAAYSAMEELTPAIGISDASTEIRGIILNQEPDKQPAIKIAPIKQDNNYIKLFTGKPEDDYNKYLEIRPEYINTPTFFFDVADLFFKNHDKEKAIRILTSIADMELENASLFRLLGYRLKEYGEYDLEQYVCKKVIQWRPTEPQSYRDYALALADAGKYQEAANILYSVLTNSYSKTSVDNSSKIMETVITELNSMVANNKFDHSFIDRKLRSKNMPVDIRVVINWNMNNTDIDLHVKDPNKETCFYNHRQTRLGGLISGDITDGYGPEQFMLKKAAKGIYEVYVNYYGDSRVKAEGPSTVMIEIFTDYSGKAQKRQVVCVQLSGKERTSGKELLKVAEFEFD